MPIPRFAQLLESVDWPAGLQASWDVEAVDMTNDLASDYSDSCQKVNDAPFYARVEPLPTETRVDLNRIAPMFINEDILRAPVSLMTYLLCIRNGFAPNPRGEDLVLLAAVGLTMNEIGAKHKHLLQRGAMLGLINPNAPKVVFGGEFLIDSDRSWYANFCSGTYSKVIAEELAYKEKISEKIVTALWTKLLVKVTESIGIPRVSVCPECERAPCLPRFSRYASHTIEHLRLLVRQGYDVRLFEDAKECKQRQNYPLQRLTWEAQNRIHGKHAWFQQKFPEPSLPPEGTRLVGGKRSRYSA